MTYTYNNEVFSVFSNNHIQIKCLEHHKNPLPLIKSLHTNQSRFVNAELSFHMGHNSPKINDEADDD
jgi:hypothetical protein